MRKTLPRLHDDRGSLSMELVLILPLLLWGLAVTVVAYDGFRGRTQAQMAAQTVSDLLSRETNMFTAAYLEGMNDVFDYLAESRRPARIRVSSVIWDSTEQRPRLQWSYGTRGLAPLPDEVFALLQSGDMGTLTAMMAGGLAQDAEEVLGANILAQGGVSSSLVVQPPVPDLISRIPPILPGEAMILVETFAIWTPFANVGVGQVRFSPVVVTRPRFSPWVNLEGAIPVFPEDDYELATLGYVPGVTDLPDPNDNQIPDPIPDPVSTIVNMTFDGATRITGWSETTTSTSFSTSVGAFLGPFGRETFAAPLTYSVNLGAGPTQAARIEFDLIVIDSWDAYDTTWANEGGDHLALMINGNVIAIEPFQVDLFNFNANNRRTVAVFQGARYVVTTTRTSTGTNLYGGGWNDQIWRVVIDIESPPATFTLGLSANLDEARDNESFGIDNFRITATAGTPAVFNNPPVAPLLGTDPINRTPVYGGCPAPMHPAPWLSLTNADLATPVPIRRRARGATLVSNCAGVNGQRYAHASASFVLNYDNQGQSGTNRRLRIRTDDSNSGRSCDSTLLILDPANQWWFNDDISLGLLGVGADYNSRLEMGNAPSGVYHVWVGLYGGNACTTRVFMERY